MPSKLAYVLVLLLACVCETEDPEKCTKSLWPDGDPRRCQTKLQRKSAPNKLTLGVTPGYGWDNIRNREAGLVIEYTYYKCQLTLDRLYLIPDACFAEKVHTISDQMDSVSTVNWLDLCSSDSTSINVNAEIGVPGLFKVSGSYSTEKTSLRSKQQMTKTMTTRASVKYEKYKISVQPGSELSKEFRRRLLSIAECIEEDLHDKAVYEAQLLVRDFGTHVITSITAGAEIIKEDSLDENKADNLNTESEKSKLELYASVSFIQYHNLTVSAGASKGTALDKSDMSTYNNITIKSTITAHGGGLSELASDSFREWAAGVDNNMITLDRAGKPLDRIIQHSVLPELSAALVSKIAELVKNATLDYYTVNTIKGCTDVKSANYNPFANSEDPNACSNDQSLFYFGGVVQVCHAEGATADVNPCTKLQVANSKTGTLSCANGNKPMLLSTGSMTEEITYNYKETCNLLFTCDRSKTLSATARYHAYWCSGNKSTSENSYMFGGVYSSTNNNYFTNQKSCPVSYEKVSILGDLIICIASKTGPGKKRNIPFGGFFSCYSDNPYVGNKSCPGGYSTFLAVVHENCQIHYCVIVQASLSSIALKRPPFMLPPTDYRQSEFGLISRTPGKYNLTRKETAVLCAGIGAASLLLSLISWMAYMRWRHQKFHVAKTNLEPPSTDGGKPVVVRGRASSTSV